MISRIIATFLIFTAVVAVLVLPKTKWAKLLELPHAHLAGQTAPTPQIFPKPKEVYSEAPQISARSAVVIDARTGISLFEKDPNLKHLPASTTKMMTALVALQKCDPAYIVTVNSPEKEGSKMGLVEGDRVSVETLIRGMMIASANDAALTLSQNCATSYEDFISRMNKKAQELNMKNSHFVNPAGFDNDLQYSTAIDLAKLARVALANPIVADAVKTRSTVVTDAAGLKTYFLENVDKLLGIVEGLDGGKTGQTEGSLENLITKTTRENNSVIVSVLGSKDRFGETQKLIEWAFANYSWK